MQLCCENRCSFLCRLSTCLCLDELLIDFPHCFRYNSLLSVVILRLSLFIGTELSWGRSLMVLVLPPQSPGFVCHANVDWECGVCLGRNLPGAHFSCVRSAPSGLPTVLMPSPPSNAASLQLPHAGFCPGAGCPVSSSCTFWCYPSFFAGRSSSSPQTASWFCQTISLPSIVHGCNGPQGRSHLHNLLPCARWP